ncbi:MAG: hypothetical protein D6729_10210 [Deltaproteobacteria bacterium]|nr:MAG: hypothetical protein D6729_10210 [Deltaproteobacteria bacterium]
MRASGTLQSGGWGTGRLQAAAAGLLLLGGLVGVLFGCLPRPEDAAQAYAEAVEAGQLEAARRHLDPKVAEGAAGERWAARLADTEARRREAAAARAAARGHWAVEAVGPQGFRARWDGRAWRLCPPTTCAGTGTELATEAAGGSAEVAEPPAGSEADAAAAAGVVRAFLAHVKAGAFAQAWRLLSAAERARYTPERLAADFEAGGSVAEQTLARIAQALETGMPLHVAGEEAWLRLGGGEAVWLRREEGAWRIAALHGRPAR